MAGGMAGMLRRVAEFWREFDRGLAVGHGHERPRRGGRLRKPESGMRRRRYPRHREAREKP